LVCCDNVSAIYIYLTIRFNINASKTLRWIYAFVREIGVRGQVRVLHELDFDIFVAVK